MLPPRRLPQLQASEAAGPLLVAPIYASLPAAQQLRVFEPAPAGMRKVPHCCPQAS